MPSGHSLPLFRRSPAATRRGAGTDVFGGYSMNRIKHLALALCGLTVASPALADYVVVKAAGPSSRVYPVGRQIPDNSRIDLRDGDALLLLGASSTRQLRGPGSFTVGGGALALNSRGRFGAQRAMFLRPSAWEVDVAKGGPVCVDEPADFALWRADASQAQTVRIERQGQLPTVIAWPVREAKLAWPGDLPIADGLEYSVKIGDSDPVPLSFRKLPASPADQLELAQVMIARQCNAQLDTVIRQNPAEE